VHQLVNKTSIKKCTNDKGQENFSRYKTWYRFEHTSRFLLRISSHKIALVHLIKMGITVLKENAKCDALKRFLCTKSCKEGGIICVTKLTSRYIYLRL
jgi:hypothetical protein